MATLPGGYPTMGTPYMVPQPNVYPNLLAPPPNREFDGLMDFAEYFKIYFYVQFSIATPTFFFLIYLIFHKTPKEMSKTIKYLLINSVITNYLVALVFFLWQPVPIVPFLGGFSLGPFKYLKKEGTLLAMNLASIGLVGTLLSMLACQTQKVVVFQPPGPITDFLLEKRNFVGSYVVLMVVNVVVLVGTLRLALTVPKDFTSVLDTTKGSYAVFYQLMLREVRLMGKTKPGVIGQRARNS